MGGEWLHPDSSPVPNMPVGVFRPVPRMGHIALFSGTSPLIAGSQFEGVYTCIHGEAANQRRLLVGIYAASTFHNSSECEMQWLSVGKHSNC